jgi:hypothetical protein
MACSLNPVSIIDDLQKIRAVLLPHLLDSVVDNDYQTTETDVTDDDETPSEIILIFPNNKICLISIF